jgi:Flp pilus assembly protein CpaB
MIKVRLMSLAILVLLLASCGNEPYRSLPAVRIPPGMRAVKILVHENISVAPGDHVDVLVIGEGKESSTVLQNVEVVEEDQKVGVVEFFVSPDDAQRVTQAGERGQFRLRLWKSD